MGRCGLGKVTNIPEGEAGIESEFHAGRERIRSLCRVRIKTLCRDLKSLCEEISGSLCRMLQVYHKSAQVETGVLR